MKSLTAAGIILLFVFGAIGATVSDFKSHLAGKRPVSLRNAEAYTVNSLPITTSTPQLSKEYVYTDNRLLLTEDAVSVNTSPPTDLAVWRPSNGYWYVLNSQTNTQTGVQWGAVSDLPAPGDFDGDLKTDFCVYRQNQGIWYILRSNNNTLDARVFGTSFDAPAVADYDGDGQDDVALFRSSDRTWHWLKSSGGSPGYAQFGNAGDIAVPADYDGDGFADIAVWRGSTAQFLIQQTTNNQVRSKRLGGLGDLPIKGDFDGDGKFDCAVWRTNNYWLISKSAGGSDYIEWGIRSTDKAVAGDYDADGKTDIAVYREGSAPAGPSFWYIRKSKDGQTRSEQWGQHGDVPVPAPYSR